MAGAPSAQIYELKKRETFFFETRVGGSGTGGCERDSRKRDRFVAVCHGSAQLFGPEKPSGSAKKEKEPETKRRKSRNPLLRAVSDLHWDHGSPFSNYYNNLHLLNSFSLASHCSLCGPRIDEFATNLNRPTNFNYYYFKPRFFLNPRKFNP